MDDAPQPQATPPPTTFVDLPNSLVLSILGRIPCKDDRRSMSLVCQEWRALIITSLPRPLPGLLLPSRFPDGPFRLACNLSDCGVHCDHESNGIFWHGARFVGSYDGAWIFLWVLLHDAPAGAHFLHNFRTNQVRRLPSLLQRWNRRFEYMSILAATLSSTPDDNSCIGAAIVIPWRLPGPHDAVAPLPPLRRCLAFWWMGSACAMAYEMVVHRAVYHMDDVVYHDGAFNVLVNHGGHILRCTQDAPVHMNLELRRFRPAERIYEKYHVLRGRYLVESRGELLKVIRWKRHGSLLSAKFRVFRATQRPQMPVDDDFPVALYPWEWIELDTLGGRILFIGYGCSRSYEVDQYPGFKAGVYFLDDGKFYDEGVLFWGIDIRPYPCSDNGMWSDSEGRSQSFFHGPPIWSRHSPPAWLLP